MPIKHIHKSLAVQMKKKTLFYVNFPLLSSYLFWLVQAYILTTILTIFFIYKHTIQSCLVKWNIRDVRQASKSTTELSTEV